MIKNFTPRLYQQTIFSAAAQYNTLVVLPTGLGKTAIAFLLAAHRLQHYQQSKILMLAPTKPLCEQHRQTFCNHLSIPEEKIALFTGDISPETREKLWNDATIIISTPQGLENDIINKRVRLNEVSLLVIDEAHHAVGDYAYVWIAQQYDKACSFPRILALTASPGNDLEKVKEICHNLYIEKVEVRTDRDADVQQYIQPLTMNWIMVPFPAEYKPIQQHLQACLRNKLLEVKNYGYCKNIGLSKGEILDLQLELQQLVSSEERNFETLRSLSLIAEALKIEHGLELLETQGAIQLQQYMEKLSAEAKTSTVKAVKNLVADVHFKSAVYLTEEVVSKKIIHPKMVALKKIIVQEIEKTQLKAIIFTQFRNSAEEIVKELSSIVKAHLFVGQTKKKGIGFSQKQQKGILEQFKEGQFNVLVATSVAEEGLDIPKVEKVIFYEPVPSAIRSIQRRGRTARLEKGEVTILVTSGTRDEAYRWSSFHKEKQMYRNLERLRTDFSLQTMERKKETAKITLNQFISQDQVIAVVADHREKGNKVVKELLDLGISVKTAQLESADYVLSGKVGVELKKVPDFVDSIIDGRTLEQIRSMKQHFEKAVLIIEGEENLYGLRNIHDNAIRGMLAAIALDFHVPIIFTRNYKDTAAMLAIMAKREQDKGRDYSLHEKKPHVLREQQEFLVSALPGIGVVHAKKLLERYKSVKNFVNTNKEELTSLEGIGEKIAERLLKLFEEEYK